VRGHRVGEFEGLLVLSRCYNYASIYLALSTGKKGISGCDLCGHLGLIIYHVPLEQPPSLLPVLEYAESTRLPTLARASSSVIL